jgi:hypothetical protein
MTRPDLRAVIDASRGTDDPDADDRARVRNALVTKLGAAALVTTAATASSSSIAAAATKSVAVVAARYLAALALTSALGAGAVVTYRTRHHAPTPAPIAAPTRRVVRAPAAPRVITAPVEAPPPQVIAPVETPPTVVRARPARPEAEGIESVPFEAPSDIRAEVNALEEAYAALEAGDAERSLRVLEDYAAQHPGGSMRIEREAARLIAQCRLGRARELEVTSFLTHRASSPLAARVARACGR